MSCSKAKSMTVRNSLLSAAAILMAAWYSAESEGAAAPFVDRDTVKVSSIPETVALEVTPSPAIWKASDADTNVYLFGTVHLLKGETKWETGAFQDIFDEAAAIYMEADTSPEAQAKLGPIVQKHAFFQNGETLSGVLGDQKDIVEAGAKTLGLPYQQLETLKPWFVAIQFAGKQMIDAGYQPGAGVETVITAKAKAAKKPMRFFESADEQLTILSSFPMDGQVRFLSRAAKEINMHGMQQLDELVTAWQAGDVDGIQNVVLKDMALSTPAVYEKIIVERNTNWTDQLKKLMDNEAGTFLVAVGALHLAGKDSVINMLKAEDVKVVRQ